MHFLGLACFGVLFLLTLAAYAHRNHDHSSSTPPIPAPKVDAADLSQINVAYQREVKSIFQVSCFDCHSNETRYPWYSNFPFAKSLIAEDIVEAKKHLNMSGGFPFQGHGNPKEDLEAIREAIRDESMPPLRYRMMHWGSSLSEEEKAAVFQWIEESLKFLEK